MSSSVKTIIVTRHVIRYTNAMIKTFANEEAESVFSDGKAKSLPPDVLKRARRKLYAIDAATAVGDLRIPPGNRLHLLKGNRAGQYAISVNDQWRICFSFRDGDAYDVELCDYH